MSDPSSVTNQPGEELRRLRRLRHSNAVYRARRNRTASTLLAVVLLVGVGLLAGLALHDVIASGAARVGGWR